MVFLFLYSLGLTLSPGARYQGLDVKLSWSHWIGFAIWCAAMWSANFFIERFAPNSDPYLLPLAGILTGWGIMTIWRLEPNFGLKQSIWLLVCVGVLIAGLKFKKIPEVLYQYKYLFLLSGLLLTALTLIFGTNPTGAGPRLWLGCCGLYFQPSEPLKLLLVIYLAAFFAERMPIREGLFPLLFPSLILTGLALAILISQRDLGTASIFIFLYAAMVYMASGKKRVLLAAFGMLILAGLVGYFFVDVVHYRLLAWLDPWADPSGRSYQIIQSLMAVANGGLYGRGPGMGSPWLVPVAQSDFIFTSIAEETGMVGSIALFAILAIMVLRGFLISLRASSNFHRLLAAGITTYFGAQSILIIGGNLRLLPLTGVTLPFVSYGGSSLLTSMIGLMLLIHFSSDSEDEPVSLAQPAPFLNVASLIGVGLLACALTYGWWSNIRADNLLARTDNPRRAIADKFIKRGSILDRQNRPIDITVGQPGTYTRKYLVPELSPIIGYTQDTYGQAGLEASFDPFLRGLRGNPTLQTWWENALYGQPQAGLNIRLSLDIDSQKLADQALGDQPGALVLLNAQTGEILAMASHPYFDANHLDTLGENLAASPEGLLLDRATQGSYQVGTSVQPFLDAAFNNQKVDNNEIISLFSKLGFYKNPNLDLPAAAAAPEGTFSNLSLSPVQILPAVAALSYKGICPVLTLTNAIEISGSGWTAIPSNEKPATCFSAEGAMREIELLRLGGRPFWEYTSTSSKQDAHVTWFFAGTMPNWSGTPLALVIVIEENDVQKISQMGEKLMKELTGS